ncbi:hypothetical protein OAS81_04520 [Gammaproteobacteria bacterium]|nr:hypothetical protein [Gammaproteobacteria bacterium]
MIYVFSDSHARSFAFLRGVVPVFVGPAGFNNFNTDINSKTFNLKTLAVLEFLASNDVVLINFGSGLRHHDTDLEHFGTYANDVVKRFCDFINTITDSFSGLVVCTGPTPPGSREKYTDKVIVEAKLVERVGVMLEAALERVCYINFPSDAIAVDQGLRFLSNNQMFDSIHINQYLAQKIVNDLPSVQASFRNADQYLRYVSSIETPAGLVKIHGDITPSDLEVRKGSELFLPNLLKETALISDALEKLFIEGSGVKRILFLNPAEGWPVVLAKKYWRSAEIDITYTHSDELKSERSFIFNLSGLSANLLQLNQILDQGNKSSYDFIVFCESEYMNRKDKVDLLKALLRHTDKLLFRSSNIGNDKKSVSRLTGSPVSLWAGEDKKCYLQVSSDSSNRVLRLESNLVFVRKTKLFFRRYLSWFL